jgi:hypothetical protein
LFILAILSRSGRRTRFGQAHCFQYLAFLRIDEKFFSKILQKQRDKPRNARVINHFPVPLGSGTKVGQGGTSEVDR